MEQPLPEIPYLDPALVAALDRRFPERCPDPEWPDRKVWVETGKREVVRFLLSELEEQAERKMKSH